VLRLPREMMGLRDAIERALDRGDAGILFARGQRDEDLVGFERRRSAVGFARAVLAAETDLGSAAGGFAGRGDHFARDGADFLGRGRLLSAAGKDQSNRREKEQEEETPRQGK
jgi:hypothetical protein